MLDTKSIYVLTSSRVTIITLLTIAWDWLCLPWTCFNNDVLTMVHCVEQSSSFEGYNDSTYEETYHSFWNSQFFWTFIAFELVRSEEDPSCTENRLFRISSHLRLDFPRETFLQVFRLKCRTVVWVTDNSVEQSHLEKLMVAQLVTNSSHFMKLEGS